MHEFIFNNIAEDKAPYPKELDIFNGVVKSVNGEKADDDGNVEVTTAEIETTTTGNTKLTVNDKTVTLANETFVNAVEGRINEGYDKDANVVDHLRLNVNTGETVSGGWAYTMLNNLGVEPNTLYKVHFETTDAQNVICEYDKDGNFIQGTAPRAYDYTFTTTPNTKFIRVCFHSNNFAHNGRVYSVDGQIESEIYRPTLATHVKGLIDKQDKLTAVAPIVIDANNNIKYQA